MNQGFFYWEDLFKLRKGSVVQGNLLLKMDCLKGV